MHVNQHDTVVISAAEKLHIINTPSFGVSSNYHTTPFHRPTHLYTNKAHNKKEIELVQIPALCQLYWQYTEHNYQSLFLLLKTAQNQHNHETH